MKRLAVCGWDERTAALLRAISLRSDLRAVAIGDDRPASLVRAKSATGLPCYQHLREMLRAVEYDAVLISDTADREALVQLAAERHASVLIRGDVANASTLRAATEAVSTGAEALSIVRPEFHHAGIELLRNLTNSDLEWAPQVLHIELSDPNGVAAALSAVSALVVRLQPVEATQVAVATLRAHSDMPVSATLQIRHGERALSVITVHDRLDERWRIAIEAAWGTAEFTNREAVTSLTIEPAGAKAEQSELVDDDLLDLEAVRLADPASRRIDERCAPHEAALLTAIEASMSTGFVTPVRDPGARGNLRVLQGGQATTSRRAGHLRVLGS
jgi:hypothetical protein